MPIVAWPAAGVAGALGLGCATAGVGVVVVVVDP
jgi:hypothetical protein